MDAPSLLAILACCWHMAEGEGSHTQNTGHDINVVFTLEGGQVNLNLKENPHVPSTFPVLLGRNGDLTNWTSATAEFTAYLDQEHGASLLVRNGTTRGESELTGIFRVADKDYVLEPARHPQSNRSKRSLTFDLGNLTSVQHVIYEASDAGLKFEDDTQTASTSGTDDTRSHDPRSRVSRSVPSGSAENLKQAYALETLIAVDFPIYRRWFEYSTASDDYQREEDAIENIRFYFAHVLNGMDLRYQSINQANYSIYVRMAGLYIAMTPEDSYWTERSENKDAGYPRNFTHAYRALDDFETWVNEAEALLPRFDHAAVFSGNELFSNYYNDSSHREIAGLARYKGICTSLSVSINQENGQYASIQTAAHEVGHSLGAVHDRYTSADCNTSDQYIMASSPGELTSETYRNALTFSPCSIRSFQEHLEYLTSQNRNCLLNQVNHVNMEEMLGHLSTQAGQLYSPDVQCRLIYGEDSFYCAGWSSDSEICRKMMCYDPVLRRCSRYSEQRAAEGTSCGNHKWCLGGDCVYDEKAPVAPDRCLYGDFKDSFPGGQTCAALVTDTPWECYRDYWFGECCESCASISNASWTECEFGNHERGCDTIESRDCYYNTTRQRCCATCEERMTDEPDCPFGDDASWCKNMSTRSCYATSDICCETCALRHGGNDACPYGNMASWCPDQDFRNCYGNNDVCCESCQLYYTGVPGCEYGDRDRYCTMLDCEEPARRQACCGTCDYVTETVSTSTTQQTVVTTATTTPATICPFGDWAYYCANQDYRLCYDNNRICCSTCRHYYTGIVGCEYGDPHSSCTVADCDNPDMKHHCCFTCHNVLNQGPHPPPSTTTPPATANHPDCPLGDFAYYCPLQEPRRCYDNHRTCCQTCSGYYTGIVGCEFGDRGLLCKPSDCAHPITVQACCSTCRDVIVTTSPTTPPTTTSTSATTTASPTTTSTTATTTTMYTTSTTTEVTSPLTVPVVVTSSYPACPFGDFAYYCADQDYRDCYQNQRTCCVTCAQYFTGIRRCEFGDKGYFCKPADCENPVLREACCMTCLALEANPPTTPEITTPPTTIDPECVDGADWCATLQASQCYNTDVCCSTCRRLHRATDTCVYGDHAVWCAEYVQGSADCALVTETCCLSCVPYKITDIEGCEFGDINSDCTPLHCTDIENAQNCCLTCHGIVPAESTRVPEGTSPEFRLLMTPQPSSSTTHTPPPTTTTSATTNASCRDDASWCAEMSINRCYVSDDVCCATCRPHYRNNPSCEYGDRADWCTDYVQQHADECLQSDILRETCCLTCGAYT